MKLHVQERDIHSSGMDNVKQTFGIRQNAKMFRILSDQLYSNKPDAVIRELGCNAYDAHVAAGKQDVPFRCHLPTMIEPWLEIQDYGIGLSHEDIMSLYTTYGDSTKGNSNLFIGALGLGSKSPFAYTDNFTVTSVFNGEQRIYNAYINETGEPTITMVGSAMPTVDCNGITIHMPVDSDDFTSFHKSAVKYYKYLPTIPNVNVGDGEIVKPISVLSGSNWELMSYEATRSRLHYYYGETSNKEDTIALMGNVPYPIDFSSIQKGCDTVLYSEFVSSLSYYSFILKFELGDLDIAASREALSYDDVTINNIVAVFKTIREELATQLDTQLVGCKTLWEASVKHQSQKDIIKLLGSDASQNFTWQGKEHNQTMQFKWNKEDYPDLEIHMLEQRKFSRHTIGNYKANKLNSNIKYKRDSNGLKIPIKDANGKVIGYETSKISQLNVRPFIETNEEGYYIRHYPTLFVWYDTSVQKQYRIPSRLHLYVNNNYEDHNVVVINTDDPTLLAKIYEELGSPPLDKRKVFHTDIPDNPRQVRSTTIAGGGTSKKTTATKAMLHILDYNSSSYYANPQDNFSNLEEVDLTVTTSGFWVDILKYKYTHKEYDSKGDEIPNTCGGDISLRDLNTLAQKAHSNGIISDPKVYCCSGSYKNRVAAQPGWHHVGQYIYYATVQIMNSQAFKDKTALMYRQQALEPYRSVITQLHNEGTAVYLQQRYNDIVDMYTNVFSEPRAMEYVNDIEWLNRAAAEAVGKSTIELDKDTYSVYNECVLKDCPLLMAIDTSVTPYSSALVDYVNKV